MQKVDQLFEAAAYDPCQVANLENGNAGFRIPEYQRPYDWKTENIHRLMTDIFAGFERLSHSANANAFTFLGTLILVKDKKKESNFNGTSFSIVDGQQRLTTLALISCALIERLRILKLTLPKLDARVTGWLDAEMHHFICGLGECVVGVQNEFGKEAFYFPRIVRSIDIRGNSLKEENLNSAIAKFLKAFSTFIINGDAEFIIPSLGKSREAIKVTENFSLIQNYCKNLNDPHWFDENDCEFLNAERFAFGGNKKLWAKTLDILDSDGSSEISAIEKQKDAHEFFRTLMLSSYFCNCIALTTVITTDETAAFDIFDALNTTGEPLTALETLRPQVISAVNALKAHKYESSVSRDSFAKIDSIFENDYPDTTKKQNETKDLVITFSLYLQGKKISRELGAQRSAVRQAFQDAAKSGESGITKFMEALEGITTYRSSYWVSKNSSRINNYHKSEAEADEVKLLSGFISSMNTSLALPILTRYWIKGRDSDDFKDYIDALKAVTAFLALRRAATGKTDGIDLCFRDIMEESTKRGKFGLCAGTSHTNKLLSIDELKSALYSKLQSSRVKFSSRDEWVQHVIDVPIYNDSKPLVRFLLFAATHNTAQDKSVPGLLTREGISPSDDRDYFSFKNWEHSRYKTVEHIAPNSDKTEGWDEKIYANARLKNTLGNFILLPVEENSRIGNSSWNKKKLFYSALVAKTPKKRKKKFDKAKTNGLSFHKKTEELITSGKRLSLLDGIEDVGQWDADFISKRSTRLAELAWDQLIPWLQAE